MRKLEVKITRKQEKNCYDVWLFRASLQEWVSVLSLLLFAVTCKSAVTFMYAEIQSFHDQKFWLSAKKFPT